VFDFLAQNLLHFPPRDQRIPQRLGRKLQQLFDLPPPANVLPEALLFTPKPQHQVAEPFQVAGQDAQLLLQFGSTAGEDVHHQNGQGAGGDLGYI